MTQWEREEMQFEEDLNDGFISLREYNREMKEIQRDYRCAAQEAAREAYERELDRW